MNKDNFFIRLIVNGLIGCLLGAFTVGVLGLFLAGYQGLLNGLIFGGAFGIIGGFATMGMIENTVWFTGTIYRYGQRRHSDMDDN